MARESQKGHAVPVLKRYGRAVLKYPWLLAATITAIIVTEASAVIAPLFFKEFIDTLSANTPSSEVLQALFLILASYAGVMLVNWFGKRARMNALLRIDARVPADLMNEAYTYMLGHSHEFFTNNFVGSLTKRINRYSRAFQQVNDSILLTLFPTALYGIGAIVILFTQNIWLGTGVAVWALIFLGVQFAMTKWRYEYKLERTAADTKVSALLSDSVGNYASVKLYAAEAREGSAFAAAVDAWRAATQKSWNTDMLMYAVQGFLSILVEIVLLVGSVFLWQQGYITVGDFVLIQVYILALVDRIWGIGSIMRHLYDSFADAHEMVEIFDTPYQVADAADSKPLSLSFKKISFEGVSFWYSEERPILKDFMLDIPGGQKTALVGPSGAGKSTITKLLLRLQDVTGGAVTIDGQDLREVTQQSLREAISFVPQEPVLFHRSLRENIAYGKPDATLEEIIEASKKAHCHEFIEGLAQGYDTHVGERGVKLSGGERQRVAIARAILKNAPILVLDEATSSLDSESEALIQDALRTLMEGKTVIVIAHRLSTIMRMDRIVVIEGGKVAASGTHADLLADKNGLYQKLWNIQAGGFIEAP